MATPLLAGAAIAGAALLSRAALLSLRTAAARAASGPRIPRAFQGGFEAEMTRKEALLVLNLREGATRDQVRDAHRKLMMLNHPDRGGSQYVTSKVNEAKDLLMGSKRGGSVF
mmetsp:Transcript_36128/g.88286  ORF Transcript_36128/g.88286 Transcript_36128/m.88286 type:complete len:113 (-) Transcript_36128:391-729(-)